MSSKMKSKGLVAAMENIHDDTEVVVLEPIEMDKDHSRVIPIVDEAANSGETKLLDMAESEDEMNDHEAMIDEASETVATLEAIHDHLKVSAENGGMDRYSAGAITAAVEALYDRVGISANNMPAMEAYGGAASRMGTTQLALEDMRANIAKIWDAIITALKNAWNWIKSFFQNVGAAARAQLQRAKQFVETKVSGQPKETTIDNAEMAKAIGSNGSVRPDSILRSIEILNRRATQVYERSDAYMTHNAERIIAAIEKSLASPEVSLDFTIDAEQEHIPETEVLPGNMQFTFNAPKNTVSGEEAVAALSAMKDNGIHPSDKVPTVNTTALTVLTPEAANKAASQIEQILEKVLKYLESLDVKNRIKAAGVAAMEKAKRAQETAGEQASKGYDTIKKLAQSLVSVCDKAVTSFCAYVVRICKRLLDYIAESLNKYQQPEAPKQLENNPTNSVELPATPKAPAAPAQAVPA